MKRILCIVVAFVAAGLLAYAGDIEENTTPKPLKYEVRIGVSGYPVTSLLTTPQVSFFKIIDPFLSDDKVSDMYKESLGDLVSTGNISAEFDFIFKRWLTFSFGVYGEGLSRATYDGMSGARLGVARGCTVTILPMARFTYLSRDWVKLYSGAGVGMVFSGMQGGAFHCIPTFQTVPFGVSFGHRVFGFAEMGLGLTYCGMNAGIGYRF